MTALPKTLRVVKRWLVKAEQDLRVAEHILDLKTDCPFDFVCFHAQQCAEKYLKALLALHRIPFGKTHDLTELALLIPGNAKAALSKLRLAELNPYAVEARYPGEGDEANGGDALQALRITRQIRDLVRAELPQDVPTEKNSGK